MSSFSLFYFVKTNASSSTSLSTDCHKASSTWLTPIYSSFTSNYN